MPLFSPSTLGFYDPSTHSAWPDDAVKISADVHEALMVGQAQGKRIVPGKGGVPELADPAKPTDDEARAATKAQARRLMAATDYTQTADVAADLKNVVAFTEYRAALRAIFRDPPVEPEWPDVPTPDWA